MPNRILKESICTSSNLNNLSSEAEVFFYRLLVNCDDFGRMDARPAILRARLYPLRTDTINEEHVSLWLRELVDQELLSVYDVTSQHFLQVKTWENHQQIRAKRSKYPDPNGRLPTIDNTSKQPPKDPVVSKDFEIFWTAYPKKKSRGEAEKAFSKIKPDEKLLVVIMAAIERAKLSEEWLKDGGQFIPYPATWLNKKGWLDEYTEKSTGLKSKHGDGWK